MPEGRLRCQRSRWPTARPRLLRSGDRLTTRSKDRGEPDVPRGTSCRTESNGSSMASPMPAAAASVWQVPRCQAKHAASTDKASNRRGTLRPHREEETVRAVVAGQDPVITPRDRATQASKTRIGPKGIYRSTEASSSHPGNRVPHTRNGSTDIRPKAIDRCGSGAVPLPSPFTRSRRSAGWIVSDATRSASTDDTHPLKTLQIDLEKFVVENQGTNLSQQFRGRCE